MKIKVPPKVGGFGDVDGGWMVWSSAGGGGAFARVRSAIWLSRIGWRKPKLVKEFPKDNYSAGEGINYPYVTWVEYPDTGSNVGPWDIVVYNIETSKSRVVRSWADSGSGKDQPIPLPYLDPYEPLLVWEQVDRRSGHRAICIHLLDIRSNEEQVEHCTRPVRRFPHFPRVREGYVSYIENTDVRGPQGSVSLPRSPDHPEFEDLFEPGGELQEWDLMTRSVQADSRGVAWVAEATEFAGGAFIFYWEPGVGVRFLPTRDVESPAARVELLRDAIVWEEPEEVNDVLAVRRGLLGCESATRRVAQPWLQKKGKRYRFTTFGMMGTSPDSVAVIQFRYLPKGAGPLPSTMGIFELPGLPKECEG